MSAMTPEKTGLITLRGSTDTVVEFFGYAINSILYQRGVYPPENFTSVAKYGLSILVTKDKGLQEYLGEVLKQLRGWMMVSQVKKLVVVVASQVTEETLERWTFDVQVNDGATTALAIPQTQADKVREQKEIQASVIPADLRHRAGSRIRAPPASSSLSLTFGHEPCCNEAHGISTFLRGCLAGRCLNGRRVSSGFQVGLPVG
eukprot:s241_g12.t1